ncbi:MFS transporter [Roseicella sp. DB1501]|uniref:MFS transporter n=1 Tax=Roseicella sp. DB1501 TaxID=2730925 RepID=UPI001492792D|nr:MFS transporter [Roseicella sp. DB1501]NOG70750.1 MFS transporter [Roseicella sp. DB1501]
MHAAHRAEDGVDSRYAWMRLGAAVLLSTIGGVGLWSIVVALPAVQAEFGTARADASLPYTLTTLGFAAGGILMGRLADRFGVMLPVLIGIGALALGYILSAQAGSMGQFAVIHGGLIGLLGACATFGPVVADTSLWFRRRRGFAVSLAASGNYFAGAVWPPLVQAGIASYGWRQTHVMIGIACLVLMLPLAMVLRRPAPRQDAAPAAGRAVPVSPLGLAPNSLQALLAVAGVACCIAMAMPQVHIVAYCSDLGYGPARGAEMLSVMLACGVVSRLSFGAILDRIGSTATLLLSATLQAVALALFLPFDGLVSLYLISGIFGLFQGGIVSTYAVIVRENVPAREVGTRVGIALSATLVGMAIGGWMSGLAFDLTGSYRAAVLNGIAWNTVTIGIAGWLVLRRRTRLAYA